MLALWLCQTADTMLTDHCMRLGVDPSQSLDRGHFNPIIYSLNAILLTMFIPCVRRFLDLATRRSSGYFTHNRET